MSAAEVLPGSRGRILIVADHASNAVPGSIDLGIADHLLGTHIAGDAGTQALARQLAGRLLAPAVVASFSRLIVDLNRAPDDDDAVPAMSDGVSIPGNRDIDAATRSRRLARFHAPYHAAIEAAVDACQPRLLVSLHSFTPVLASNPQAQRPWQVSLLSHRDRRAAESAMRRLAAEGLCVGDNEPYSGSVYGYTTDRHAEARGLPYLTFEIRQDELAADPDAWTERLAATILGVEADLFSEHMEISV